MKNLMIALVALFGFGLFTSPALAWVGTGNSGTFVCLPNGEYEITWTLTNVEDDPADVISSTRPVPVAGDTVPAHGSADFIERVPGTTVGTLILETVVNYENDRTPRSSDPDGEVTLQGDCPQPSTPPTTTVKKEKKDDDDKDEKPGKVKWCTANTGVVGDGIIELDWDTASNAKKVEITWSPDNWKTKFRVKEDDDGHHRLRGLLSNVYYVIKVEGVNGDLEGKAGYCPDPIA